MTVNLFKLHFRLKKKTIFFFNAAKLNINEHLYYQVGTHSRTSSLRSLLRRLEETSDSRKIRSRSDSDWFVKNNANGRK